ncbi:hypothetical protein AAJP47_07520 [Psychrobacter sp. B38]|uniref:hypothetical protein n=1 Tax=Psychrobacter sp. B38 TaxID=3143538 RepID=UPI00321053CE
MSDTQDPLIVLQRRVQQRQILAMMGIKQWVQPTSETTNVADISAPTILVSDTPESSVPLHTSASQPSINDLGDDVLNINDLNANDTNLVGLNPDMAGIPTIDNESVDVTSDIVDEDVISNISSSISSYYDHAYEDTSDSLTDSNKEQSPVTYSFDTTVPNIATTPTNIPAAQASALVEPTDSIESRHDTFLKVAPFDLQGGRYGNWVVLVDIQALNNESQKLWDNLTQALSITCETTSFPICDGMDTAELANASFAGYVFKVGRSEEIQVAALTALPEGLEHPNLTEVPTLDKMLTDSSLKRQLWEQISDQS